MEPEQDYLTCGDCQKDFLLSDIVKFIQHKINRCNKENVDPYEDNEYDEDEEDDQDSVVSNSVISARRTSISAPIAQRKASTPEHETGLKEASELRRPRPVCVDASANTTTTGKL